MQEATKEIQLRHEIFILDAHLSSSLDESKSITITRNFVGDALKALGMSALGDLGIYPATDLRAPGWSFIQPITTSHISGHYFLKPGRLPHLRLDAYSCESIDWQTLVNVCETHFPLSDWRANFIDRQIEQDLPRAVIEMSGVGAIKNTELVVAAQALRYAAGSDVGGVG